MKDLGPIEVDRASYPRLMGYKLPGMEEEYTERELAALRAELSAEKERRERAERERDELRRELEEVRPRGRPWWVLGLLVIVVVTTLVVLSLGAILSAP
jgi:cytochrome c-type biogenesis protein CcmH/NrfG